MRIALILVCGALAGAAVGQGGSVAVKDIFSESRFDAKVSYAASGKTIPEIVKELGDRFGVRLIARLDPAQTAAKPELKFEDSPLRQVLKDMAKALGSVWKRNGDILLLAPDQKKLGNSMAGGPARRDPQKFKEFMDSFTPGQLDKAKSQGELQWDDLTPSQQDYLAGLQGPAKGGDDPNSRSQMKWRFRDPDNGQDLTIVKGGN